jgi:hypothetical protein
LQNPLSVCVRNDAVRSSVASDFIIAVPLFVVIPSIVYSYAFHSCRRLTPLSAQPGNEVPTPWQSRVFARKTPRETVVIPSRVQLTLNAKAPKFLKNRETLIFQKLAGGDCSSPYQPAIKRNAV